MRLARLYRDRVRRAGGYRMRTRLKYHKGAPIFSALAFETNGVRIGAGIDLGLGVPVDTIIHYRGVRIELGVGTRCGVPRDQFAVRSSFDDSDTHPYASVDRL